MISDQVIRRNMTAVWIAGTAWVLSNELTNLPNIHTIGTIIGFRYSTPDTPLFTSYAEELFTRMSKETKDGPESTPGPTHPKHPCPQCENLSPANMSLVEDPYLKHTAFGVYAATYSVAHALHTMLNCNMSSCMWGEDSKVYPWQVNLIGCPKYTPRKQNKCNDQNS